MFGCDRDRQNSRVLWQIRITRITAAVRVELRIMDDRALHSRCADPTDGSSCRHVFNGDCNEGNHQERTGRMRDAVGASRRRWHRARKRAWQRRPGLLLRRDVRFRHRRLPGQACAASSPALRIDLALGGLQRHQPQGADRADGTAERCSVRQARGARRNAAPVWQARAGQRFQRTDARRCAGVARCHVRA